MITYPRVLVVAIGKINAADNSNNGLLLRNIFSGWPRENLAQIFSGGNNGDEGYFQKYYKLGTRDRSFGNLYYHIKTDTEKNKEQHFIKNASRMDGRHKFKISLRLFAKKIFFDTGIYELFFRPKVSKEILDFVKEFNPDIIFAQGYSFTFTWLPLMLKKVTKAQLAFFCTDDWPRYLYSGQLGEPVIFSWFIRPIVNYSVSQLISAMDIPIAFGLPMASEYSARYGKSFASLSHGDDPQRFLVADPKRIHPSGTISIVAVGNFNQFRWPLLLDANECCRLLESQGYHARVAVFSSGMDPVGDCTLAKAEFIDIVKDPGNDLLPGYLKGADILLLIEGFDKNFVSAIRLSVSSKSHLFMLSKRPIVVYAHSDTGVSKYASEYGWARTVTERDVTKLLDVLLNLIKDGEGNKEMIANAYKVAQTYHSREANHKKFLQILAEKSALPRNS